MMDNTVLANAASDSADIAHSLKRISDASEELLSSGLNHQGLVLLLRHASGVRKDDVEAVLDALPQLAILYTDLHGIDE